MRRLPGRSVIILAGFALYASSFLFDYNWTGDHCTIYYGQTITETCTHLYRIPFLAPVSTSAVTGTLLVVGMLMQAFGLGISYGVWRNKHYNDSLSILVP